MNRQARRIMFVDRDGTIVKEPYDHQVDRLEKVEFVDGIVKALQEALTAGFELVMVSNQDGLGSQQFPQEDFELCQDFILRNLKTQGIQFAEIRICPHLEEDHCACRKPGIGLIRDFLPQLDYSASFVVGDRLSDVELAQNMGIKGYQIGETMSWSMIMKEILFGTRKGSCIRETKETRVSVEVVLDDKAESSIQTGNHFFDHMLEQISRHSGASLRIQCRGDWQVDDHHAIEDVGLALGQALDSALGNRFGIERYACQLPMDESQAEVSIDLGGRPYFVFDGHFTRDQVGGLATEMIPHFFRSLTQQLRANLHMKIRGENNHHMAEACFKGFAVVLKSATHRTGSGVPSTKGKLV